MNLADMVDQRGVFVNLTCAELRRITSGERMEIKECTYTLLKVPARSRSGVILLVAMAEGSNAMNALFSMRIVKVRRLI